MCTEPHTSAQTNDNWVPRACTLPTAEQPLRVAEFDQLFSTALRGVERRAPTQLRLRLDQAAEPVARKLTARETTCCSFFSFTFSPADNDQMLLEATVSAAHVAVLDALAVRAATAASLPVEPSLERLPGCR